MEPYSLTASRGVTTIKSIITNGPLATQALGKKVAEALQKGEKPGAGGIIALVGELGCGKTCFTKGLCAGLGISPRHVNSPTFTFVNEYSGTTEKGSFPVFHLDLYRADNISICLEVGMLDYLARADSGIVVIEWAERIYSLLPDEYLEVEFSVLSPRKRRITLTGFGQRFCKLLSCSFTENRLGKQ